MADSFLLSFGVDLQPVCADVPAIEDFLGGAPFVVVPVLPRNGLVQHEFQDFLDQTGNFRGRCSTLLGGSGAAATSGVAATAGVGAGMGSVASS